MFETKINTFCIKLKLIKIPIFNRLNQNLH